MKNKHLTLKLLMAAAAILTAVSASGRPAGQDERKSDPAVKEPKLSAVRTDSIPAMLQYYLKETFSKHFEDPKIPRFLIKDHTDSFVFGVGGAVEAKVFYDSDGDRGDCFTLDREDESHSLDNGVVDFDLTATNLSFKVLGKTNKGVIDAFISADFSGAGGGSLCLQHAYVDIFGLRVGKTHTGFRDDESMDFIDGDVILSNTSRKTPQVSYSHKFKNGLRLQGGVEFPQSTYVWYHSRTEGVSQINNVSILVPDFTANLYWSGARLHLYAGADVRCLHYYNENKNFRGNLCSAFQVSGNWSFVKQASRTHRLFFQGVWTHGMADCCKNLRKKGLSAFVDYNPASFADYDITVPDAFGGSAGYQAKFGPNTIDLVYSAIKVSGHEEFNIADSYRWAQAVGVNYLRQILRYGVVGVEFLIGRKKDMADRNYTNCRGYLYLRYNF